MYNHHSHCAFCDGSNPMEDYVKQAIELGFHSYGFSSHVPLSKLQTSWSLTMEKFQLYLNEFSRLKSAYQHKINLYCGLETDFVFSFYLKKNLQHHFPLIDYTIGSVHFLEVNGNVMEVDTDSNVFEKGFNRLYNNDTEKFIRDYFAFMRRMISEEKPDIIGHLDKIKMHKIIQPIFSSENPVYCEEVDKTLNEIAKEQLILEINTRGVYKGIVQEPYPDYFIIQKAHKKGIPLQLNSDAHRPEEISLEFDKVKNQLLKLGISRQVVFQSGKWESVKL